jgi:hypothetical protein
MKPLIVHRSSFIVCVLLLAFCALLFAPLPAMATRSSTAKASIASAAAVYAANPLRCPTTTGIIPAGQSTLEFPEQITVWMKVDSVAGFSSAGTWKLEVQYKASTDTTWGLPPTATGVLYTAAVWGTGGPSDTTRCFSFTAPAHYAHQYVVTTNDTGTVTLWEESTK